MSLIADQSDVASDLCLPPEADQGTEPESELRVAAPLVVLGHDPVVLRQIPIIHQIIADETWLEGERRGQPVLPSDPVVRENVCRVVLRVGQDLRNTLQQRIDCERAA